MPAHRSRPVVPSESKGLSLIAKEIHAIALRTPGNDGEDLLYYVDKLRTFAANAEAGLHANPGALVVYGNPGVDIPAKHILTFEAILGFAEQVTYRRTKRPTGDYFHDFGPNDAVWAANIWDQPGRTGRDIKTRRVIVIANSDGVPLWGE